MPRFAANLTMMYTEYPFLERFAAAASDGFTAVEYLSPYEYPLETLAKLLSEHSLEQVLFNTPTGDWAAGMRGFACLPGREGEFRQGLLLALRYAAALQCPRVHVMSGIAPSDADPAELHRVYLRNLTWAVEQASAAGVYLLLEPINGRDMPGYFLTRQDAAHAVVAEVGSDVLKVQMDLYHCQIVEGDLEAKLRLYLQDPVKTNVGHIQVAGVPDRHEPDTGEVNFPYLLHLIDELPYTGWIGCEYRPRGGTSEGLGWMRGFR
jgi:hydroxypyruvate isomerase